MTGVQADTYTVSFKATGYDLASTPGVAVFADQVALANETLNKSLKEIVRVRSTGASSAYQPNQTVDTYTVTSSQILNFQGSSFNTSETNLLTSLPGATVDSSGYPVIHGGREYEEGFSFEGIPYVDAYSNQFNNSLAVPTSGVSLVQLTPGGGDVTQSSGGFGSFNVVAKRGTYPSYSTLGLAVGGPGFDHRLNFDWSWATQDNRFSNYFAMANSDTAYQWGREQRPYAQIGRFFSRRYDSDREVLDNFVFRFGPNKNQSVQLFADIANHQYYQGAGGFGDSSQNCPTYGTLCFASGDPLYRSIWSAYLSPAFWGLPGGFLTKNQITAISALYPGQANETQSLYQASQRAPFVYYQPNQAFKVAYTNNINSSTYLNLTAYRTNAVTTFDGPSTEGSYIGDLHLLQGGQTTGVTLSLQKQLSDQHLLQLGADVHHLHPVDSFLSDSYAFGGDVFTGLLGGAYDQLYLPNAFVSPSDPNCAVAGLSATQGCGYAYSVFPGASQVKYPQWDQISSVQRLDYSFYASDKWQPNQRLNVQIGLRMDGATYQGLPKPGIDPYTCTFLYLPDPGSYKAPTTFDAAHNWQCDAQASFSLPDNVTHPRVWQPRTGISYKIGADTAVRFTYNRAVQFVPIASIDYGEIDPRHYAAYSGLAPYDPAGVGTNCGITGYFVPCRNFGQQLFWSAQNFDGIAYQPARPTTSDNYQLSLQHQFTGRFLNGAAINISPWYRNQHDTIAAESSPILQANGQPLVVNGAIQFGPPVLTNNGKEKATGIDFNMTRNVQYGLSAQLTASYINEFSSVIPLSSLEDFYPSVVPASVALGNMYRVGFLSPFQSTLALSYHTQSGWRFTPRYSYNIGYPTGVGSLTAGFVNGVPYNLPNTNGVGAGSAPAGPQCFIDPNNPGSQFNPNVVGCRGFAEAPSAGGKLTHPESYLDLTLEYAPPHSNVTLGFNVNNVFNEVYTGSVFNSRYQPIANGISGPLTGWSTSSINYTSFPAADPRFGAFENGQGVFINSPAGLGRTIYLYMQTKV